MNLPKGFKEYFLQHWKAEDVDALVQGMESEPAVSIRLNQKRMPVESEPEGADGRVPWCPEGIYLRERPAFTADPLLHAGAYYVQEASSMYLAHVLRTLNSQLSLKRVLDLCAAPGGKSTLLRSLIPDECLLISNEPNRTRCQVLAENLAKWGHPNVLVTQALPKQLTEEVGDGAFQMILADVPCSGEGMMRKEEEASRQWSPAFVAGCAALQRSIVQDIWPALIPGGILIYSTCTFNPEEDEQNVEWIARELGADVLAIPIDPSWGIRGDMRTQPCTFTDEKEQSPLSCYHFLPGLVRGEGFFLAILRKHIAPESTVPDSSPSGKKRLKKKGHRPEPSLITLPTNQLDAPDAPHVELSLADSIRYLQREALILPPNTPRGIVQVCYRGLRLGLMNNLGTRANNLYPKEWRIRSSYVEGHSLFSE